MLKASRALQHEIEGRREGCGFNDMGFFLGGLPQSEECSKFAFELIQISDVASPDPTELIPQCKELICNNLLPEPCSRSRISLDFSSEMFSIHLAR